MQLACDRRKNRKSVFVVLLLAVFLVSAELDEILALADRIGVMYAGKIVAEFTSQEADRETLGLYMAGLGHTETPAAEP